VLRAATPALYDSDLAKLRHKVSRANAAARRAQVRRQGTSSQVTTDQQQVSSDVSTLQNDAGTLSSDVAQMSMDVQQVSADLAQLQSDAANGQGVSCENVSTVDNDASTVDGDGTTVGNDATTVTDDIDTVQGDISQLTGDLETLAKAGVSAVDDPSPQATILRAQTEIGDSLTQANSYITAVNGYLKQAYTTTNNLAASNCGGSG
jgi:chromosome segregation ATPase